MPQFHYEGATGKGTPTQGVVDAQSADHARTLVQQMGLTSVRILPTIPDDTPLGPAPGPSPRTARDTGGVSPRVYTPPQPQQEESRTVRAPMSALEAWSLRDALLAKMRKGALSDGEQEQLQRAQRIVESSPTPNPAILAPSAYKVGQGDVVDDKLKYDEDLGHIADALGGGGGDLGGPLPLPPPAQPNDLAQRLSNVGNLPLQPPEPRTFSPLVPHANEPDIKTASSPLPRMNDFTTEGQDRRRFDQPIFKEPRQEPRGGLGGLVDRLLGRGGSTVPSTERQGKGSIYQKMLEKLERTQRGKLATAEFGRPSLRNAPVKAEFIPFGSKEVKQTTPQEIDFDPELKQFNQRMFDIPLPPGVEGGSPLPVPPMNQPPPPQAGPSMPFGAPTPPKVDMRPMTKSNMPLPESGGRMPPRPTGGGGSGRPPGGGDRFPPGAGGGPPPDGQPEPKQTPFGSFPSGAKPHSKEPTHREPFDMFPGHEQPDMLAFAGKFAGTDPMSMIAQLATQAIENLKAAGGHVVGAAKAERVGDFASNLAGVPEKLSAAGGPTGEGAAAVFRLVKALPEAVEGLRDWTKQLHDSNMEFAKFSAGMAMVQAEQMVRDINLSQDRGDRRAKTAQTLAEGRSHLERALAPWEDALANKKNEILGNIADKLATMLDNLPEWLKPQKTEDKHSPKGGWLGNLFTDAQDQSKVDRPAHMR